MKFQKIEFLKQALKEDIGRGDLARDVLPSTKATAHIIAKDNGILSGVEYLRYIDELAELKIEWFKQDRDKISNQDIICSISGNSKDLLSCERVILNILQHSSGIATNAHKFAKLAKGKIHILDTRKTRPLLRTFEKYSAKVGGITNHRLGLDDCLMLKDTHLALFKSISQAIAHARAEIPWTTKIEVECETFEMAKEAMKCGVEIVMCDNMTHKEIKKVVKYRNEHYPQTLIEVSGNITLENIQKYISLGIDAISSGSIIHQAVFLDFSMKIKT
ncbi:MAG: carboxylating nicotinate-nucleotide diphosphorylase [Epsilonproteobacteria bacterium]|nr:carboxylating nicotinate-nucleotide diphosphorylase [Campylobacterota bacterium]